MLYFLKALDLDSQQEIVAALLGWERQRSSLELHHLAHELIHRLMPHSPTSMFNGLSCKLPDRRVPGGAHNSPSLLPCQEHD